MGTMADFEELVAGLKAEGIEVMLDMVLNHTSTEHEWFQRALAGEDDYRDFYYVRPASPDGGLPNNWVSKFGGPAWSRFGETDDFYLHLFDRTQADLNWHNPRVRREMAKVVEFWRLKGVRGFRFDVINLILKPVDLPSAPEGADDRFMYTDGELVTTFLRELAEASYGKDAGCVTVGEMSSTSIERCVEYSHPDSGALSMVFNFHHLKVDYADGKKWSLARFELDDLRRVLMEWADGMQAGGGWNALFWNNHDQPRALNRFGDPKELRVESATMHATVLHLFRGTPYVYMGEEIGMTDPEYSSIDDYVDVEAINAHKALVGTGMSDADAFAVVRAKARDNARTPMQWEPGPAAGFTTGTPWLHPTNGDLINAAAEEAGGRILPYYRRLIELRKSHPVISHGELVGLAPDHPHVFAYERSHASTRLLVLVNFSATATHVEVPTEFTAGRVLISNTDRLDAPATSDVELAPYEALAIILEPSES